MKMVTIENRLNRSRESWRPKHLPLISFPIATFNRSEIFIDRTLPSILSQSYSNIEVIVIGDCTKDLNYYRIKNIDSRVRFFNLKRRTVYPVKPFDIWCVAGYRPRNIAARISSGDYHWWISDDDSLEADSVRHLVDFVNTNQRIESIYGDYKFHARGKEQMLTLLNSSSRLPFPITGMPSWINRNYLSSIFKWNGYSFLNDINQPCDYDLQFRMWSNGVKLGYLNKVLANVHAFPEHDWAHGSKLYVDHPDTYA